ncbi:hypothetical protein GCM10022381_27670 [Leifsonia kafniensis]|uniref:Uncharacterized protein n=1 Tax=Leifsonia kafniensis TaxID=475957 RepID=A0ABP7KPE8_9MICO
MSQTIEQQEAARNKLRKFIERSAPGLGEPLIALRDPDTGQMAMQLHWSSDDGEEWSLSGLDQPSLDRRILNSVIVECRVFFMVGEDCYLPGIVRALQRLSPERARGLDPLKKHVAQIVRDGALVSPEGGAMMYSGRLEMDNGLGPGKLLGADQITMDYINGVAFHEDDSRRARLDNVSDMESVLLAVILQLDVLLRIVGNVRRQVMHDIKAGHISLDA